MPDVQQYFGGQARVPTLLKFDQYREKMSIINTFNF